MFYFNVLINSAFTNFKIQYKSTFAISTILQYFNEQFSGKPLFKTDIFFISIKTNVPPLPTH
jgi:hypothetical protein